jgi:prepilin-type N-terminal cleavage/methylation domain-containing protein
MSHRQKLKSNNEGFTIVELLIVIVVIGILAAITIVAYSGITARANNTKVATNAESAVKVAEAYNADTGRYPAITSEFTTGSSSTKLPLTLTPLRGPAGALTSGAFTGAQLTAPTGIPTALTGTTAATTFLFSITGTATNPTGGVIVTWDFTTNTYEVGAGYTYYGTANSSSTFLQPAS